MINEELCERVLPKKRDASRVHEHHLTDNDGVIMATSKIPARSINDDVRNETIDECAKAISEALTQGILIPSERLLTVEEIEKAIYSWSGAKPTGGDANDLAQAIHQSSRQKAGFKC